MKALLIALLFLGSACRSPKPQLKKPELKKLTPEPPKASPPVAAAAGTPRQPEVEPAVANPDPPPPVIVDQDRGIRMRKFAEETNLRLRDAYFDYDKSALRTDAQEALQHDYQILRGLLADFPTLHVVVEGHCDERGSAEYNLALGDRRANLAIQFLADLGLPSSKLRPISFGKEKPQCVDQDESCWQRNRRVHLVVSAPVD